MPDLLERLKSALGDRYGIEKEIGRGGMAVVFLAEDLKHRRSVALKVLHPELTATLGAERFLQEIEIVAGLQHPHILPLYDSGEAEGLLYYVMPYARGESLRHRLDREKQLAVDESVRLTVEVADGLDYAHRKGVVHRDIKPGNILLAEGHATIADFGIARAIEVARAERVTSTGLGVGTPLYASPEQATAQETLDGRTDIYSLGCVLYEMLAGEPPLTGATPQMIQARRLSETPTALHTVRDTVPPALDHVIARALARVPADRFATASQFGQALQAVLFSATPAAMADLAATPGSTSTTPEVINGPARRRVSVWLIAAVALVGAVGGTWLLSQRADLSDSGPQAVATASDTVREVRLASDVVAGGGAEISPDGKRVAYCRDRDYMAPGGITLVVVEVADPASARELARVDSCNKLRWLPDGSGIVFSGAVQGQRGHYLARFGSTPRLVECGDSWVFALSPDGTSCVGTGGEGGIFVGSLDGSSAGDTIAVTGEYDYIAEVDWLPSGDRLAVETVDRVAGHSGTVWTMGLDGGDQQEVVTITGSFTWRWSPDGRALYYSLWGEGGTRDVMRLPGTTKGAPTGDAEWLTNDGYLSRSADGRRAVTVKPSSRSRILRVSADTEASSTTATVDPLIDWTADLSYWHSVSHDGHWMAYSTSEGTFKMPVAGGSPIFLVATPQRVSWSPDNRLIVYSEEWQDTTRIWISGAERRSSPGMIDDDAPKRSGPGGWLGSSIYSNGLSRPNIRVLDSLKVWSRERLAWLPLDSVSTEDIELRRGIQSSGRWLIPNDSVGTWVAIPEVISPDGSQLLVHWRRTPDGSRATDSTAYFGNWLLSVDGTSQIRLSNTVGAPLEWTGDGLYWFETDPAVAVYLQPLDGSERQLVLEIPESVHYCDPLRSSDHLELLCWQREVRNDIWLIENFDPHVN